MMECSRSEVLQEGPFYAPLTIVFIGKSDLRDPEQHMSITANDRIEVKLNNVVVECRCGVHAWEKHPERPNRLSISVTLFAELNCRRIEQFGYIDYDQIRDFLKTFPTRPHTDLLETLLDEIVEKCFVDGRVDACRVSILKLDIFNETEAAGVEAYRTRAAWT
jgi:dihydroneopterin aldolase